MNTQNELRYTFAELMTDGQWHIEINKADGIARLTDHSGGGRITYTIWHSTYTQIVNSGELQTRKGWAARLANAEHNRLDKALDEKFQREHDRRETVLGKDPNDFGYDDE